MLKAMVDNCEYHQGPCVKSHDRLQVQGGRVQGYGNVQGHGRSCGYNKGHGRGLARPKGSPSGPWASLAGGHATSEKAEGDAAKNVVHKNAFLCLPCGASRGWEGRSGDFGCRWLPFLHTSKAENDAAETLDAAAENFVAENASSAEQAGVEGQECCSRDLGRKKDAYLVQEDAFSAEQRGSEGSTETPGAADVNPCQQQGLKVTQRRP